MSVSIKFEPEGRDGIVAEGSYLLDAAKRLGIRLPEECKGRGECDTCAVLVVEGATLLSSLTESERVRLSPERLAGGERLACQCKVTEGGNLVLRAVPVTERAETSDEAVDELKKGFRDLPLERKLATLVELEAVTMFQTISSLASVPFNLGERLMNVMARRGRSLSKRERDLRRPVQNGKPSDTGTEAGNK